MTEKISRESFVSYWSKISPQNKEIISQYMLVVSKFNQVFRAISLRTEGEDWKKDGVGTCWGVSKATTERFIFGPAREDLMRLRELRNDESKGKSQCGCPYHRDNRGCNLADIKSPFCISFIENGDEIYERFGITLRESDIRGPLTIILLAGTDPYAFKAIGHPEVSREFVRSKLEEIDALIAAIESFPILRPEKVQDSCIYQ